MFDRSDDLLDSQIGTINLSKFPKTIDLLQQGEAKSASRCDDLIRFPNLETKQLGLCILYNNYGTDTICAESLID